MTEPKTILTMTKREVELERFKLEQQGLLADASWYLDKLIEETKKQRRANHVQH